MSSTLFMKTTAVPTIARSSLHAEIVALRASSALSRESMKSMTSFRSAIPPLLFTNFA